MTMAEAGASEDDEQAPAPPPAMAPLFAGPVKRSMTIAGHTTSISLEPVFWQTLEEAARAAQLPLSALVARIDVQRIAVGDPPNLASAIRCWLLAEHLNSQRSA